MFLMLSWYLFHSLCCFVPDGINWLAFLNKYKLHGILCDGILLVCALHTNMNLESLLVVAVVSYIRNKFYVPL